MANKTPTFRQRDVSRAIKAIIAGGRDVARVEIEQGKVVVIVGKPGEDQKTKNDWDSV
jgi:hypothetical protein